MTTRRHRAGTRAIATLAVGLLVAVAFAAVAPGASAATNTKLCSAVDHLQDRLDSLDNLNPKNFKSNFSDAADAFKDAAKSAPKKVKKAMKRIASYLSSVASGDFAAAAQALGGKDGKAYAKSIVTYTTYVSTNCA